MDGVGGPGGNRLKNLSRGGGGGGTRAMARPCWRYAAPPRGTGVIRCTRPKSEIVLRTKNKDRDIQYIYPVSENP